jgi:hypothetical protein
MVNVGGIDSGALEPTLKVCGLHSQEIVSSSQFPRESNVEPERKQFIELVSGNFLGADDRTPRALVVMGQPNISHSMLQGRSLSGGTARRRDVC